MKTEGSDRATALCMKIQGGWNPSAHSLFDVNNNSEIQSRWLIGFSLASFNEVCTFFSSNFPKTSFPLLTRSENDGL